MSFWTGACDQRLGEAELELVKLSGIDQNEFKSYPVKFTWTKKDWKEKTELNQEEEKKANKKRKEKKKKKVEDNEYIWTYEFGDHSKPTLIIVHGYGGSGMLFFKMFKQFSEHFHVYLIDMLGMGRSSRTDFHCVTYQECENFFVNSIEKWRQKMGFEKMNLMGHSFGGFISSKYTLRLPQYINKLLLFSPWASEATTEEHKIKFDREMEELPFMRRMWFGMAKSLFKNGSPFGAARKTGRWLGGYFIRRFVKNRFPNMEPEEIDAFTLYMHQIIMRKGSSEYGFSKMFPNFMYSDKAIGNHLQEYKDLDIEISFYYGSVDCMDTSYNDSKISKQLKSQGEKVYKIKNAGHHLYFCNPDDSFKCILDDFKTSNVVKM